MKLFLNGVLAASKIENASLAGFDDDAHFLGKNPYKLVDPSGFDDLVGQIDEFRVWKVQRTGEQIRDNIHRALTVGEVARHVAMSSSPGGAYAIRISAITDVTLQPTTYSQV